MQDSHHHHAPYRAVPAGAAYVAPPVGWSVKRTRYEKFSRHKRQTVIQKTNKS
jgi:hypothetical protein